MSYSRNTTQYGGLYVYEPTTLTKMTISYTCSINLHMTKLPFDGGTTIR